MDENQSNHAANEAMNLEDGEELGFDNNEMFQVNEVPPFVSNISSPTNKSEEKKLIHFKKSPS